MACVAKVVAHTDASARIAPTDRSMPPPVITNVMPMLTTPMVGSEPEDGQRVVETGEAVTGGGDADDADHEQRDHQAEVATEGPAHQSAACRVGRRRLHVDVSAEGRRCSRRRRVGVLLAPWLVLCSLMRRFLP